MSCHDMSHHATPRHMLGRRDRRMYACTRASYFVRMRARLTGGIDWIIDWIDWEWLWWNVGGGGGCFGLQ
jgi:hypothetical protein